MGYKDKDKQREANKEAMRRKRAKGITDEVSQQGITDHNGDSVTLTDVELMQGMTPNICKYCFKQLEFAVLECCNDCAEMRSKPVSPAQDGHILASRPALEFTGKLTDFEREHYKPASQLKPGQYNPVSKPGDSHYGQA